MSEGADRSRRVLVSEVEEMAGGMWGRWAMKCPACAGTGRRMVAPGEIRGKGRKAAKLRRARNLKCGLCRGAGLIVN